jgi:hypothetical protein
VSDIVVAVPGSSHLLGQLPLLLLLCGTSFLNFVFQPNRSALRLLFCWESAPEFNAQDRETLTRSDHDGAHDGK